MSAYLHEFANSLLLLECLSIYTCAHPESVCVLCVCVLITRTGAPGLLKQVFMQQKGFMDSNKKRYFRLLQDSLFRNARLLDHLLPLSV